MTAQLVHASPHRNWRGGPGWSAIGFGLAIGAAGGAIRSVEAAAFRRYFGILYLGGIGGIVSAVGVARAAFGPVLFAAGRDLAGSYRPVLIGSAAIPLAVRAGRLASVRSIRREEVGGLAVLRQQCPHRPGQLDRLAGQSDAVQVVTAAAGVTLPPCACQSSSTPDSLTRDLFMYKTFLA